MPGIARITKKSSAVANFEFRYFVMYKNARRMFLSGIFVPDAMLMNYGPQFGALLSALLGLFFCPSESRAQADSAVALPAVTVADARLVHTGYASWRPDSLPLASTGTLAQQLLWDNTFALRANGPGVLATLSVRGTGPSHTPVFWQGLNLQSPMNGTIDAALLPVWPGDVLEIRSGGQSAVQSSGAMGGSVLLSTQAFGRYSGWSGSVGGSAGSFGQQNASVSLGYEGEKAGALLRGAWQQANNDFPFRNTSRIGAPEERQPNNFGQKLDLQEFNQWKINPRNTLETAVWYLHAFREIPPAMTEAVTDTWQRDEALRALVSWRNSRNDKAQWQHRLAWLDEKLDFFLEGDTDNSHSRTALASTEYTRILAPAVTLKAGANGSWLQARADGYADSTRWFQQKRAAALLMAEYRRGRWQASMLARQEWAEGQGAPLTWSLGSQFRLSPALAMRGHISRNFNLPTFNDRYWRSLGNPALRPEAGYSADLGGTFQKNGLAAEISAFYLLLDDWILWQPGPDGQFRPGNLRQVRSQGLEGALSHIFHRYHSQWKIRIHHQLAQTTNTQVFSAAAAGSLGKQLPYTPHQSGGISLHWLRKNWSAAYLHQWTGRRYTNSDNSHALPGFHYGSLMLKRNFSWEKHRLSLEARVDNCWNASFQMLRYRPMPGRSWYLGACWLLGKARAGTLPF